MVVGGDWLLTGATKQMISCSAARRRRKQTRRVQERLEESSLSLPLLLLPLEEPVSNENSTHKIEILITKLEKLNGDIIF